MVQDAPKATETEMRDPSQRALWLAVRQGLLLIVGAIEDYLGVDRRRR